MQSITLSVLTKTGLHSRPADLFVRTAKLYRSTIVVRKNGACADAKNIIKMILLNVCQGQEIEIEADGPDEKDALADLQRLVESDFTAINDEVRL
ncbi:phosphocarrier protein HPr [Alkalispirochaeta sphaeroplastigenens]|uniref:Phosphocarrier protein HPr n=1 Tax=Alkalispirochaeta sphaeroplastigenens TaxID=1187066 RepID=A0A2S4K1L2_9SPIO|nr:HPr family phosphocarrier protein [Alkalispirochaeta sphaeroplastigenens]POR05654.1 phosphocarrier protein HPr [Alkalispirochaeta sphaeroplastigenens]